MVFFFLKHIARRSLLLDRYGLLGPSGCGKTTLLSCIIGQCKLDAGHIQLSVKKKKEIGYMPQVTLIVHINEAILLRRVSNARLINFLDKPFTKNRAILSLFLVYFAPRSFAAFPVLLSYVLFSRTPNKKKKDDFC